MSKRPVQADDLLRFVMVGDPQIDKTGKKILFTKKVVNEKKKSVSNLLSYDLDSATITEWTQGEAGASAGRWSPDGSQISFISSREKKIAQFFTLSLEGGEAKQLSQLPEGSIGGYLWSPDSKYIAFTFRETEAAHTKAAAKEREEKGGSTPPKEIDTIWYRLDGDGYFNNARFKIYLLDVADGSHRVIYDHNSQGNYEFDWTPDSQSLIVLHSANERPMFSPANDQLYKVTLDGTVTPLPDLPKGAKSTVTCSPDGKWIAYTANEDPIDFWGTNNSRLYIIPATGGEPKPLMRDVDFDLNVGAMSDAQEAVGEGMFWKPDSSAIIVNYGWHGSREVAEVSVDGDFRKITEGHHSVALSSVSEDATKAAILYGTKTSPPELALLDLTTGAIKTLTSYNGWIAEELDVIEPEEVWIETKDGTKVHTWIIKPEGAEKAPAVLEVHGGPHAQYGWMFFHEMQLLAAQGYVVVFSNPRGSKGYGETHTAAIRSNWGVADWTDVQAVTAWMHTLPAIDRDRIAIMGGSYGGYMTNWAIGHSKDYKAAITDRCVSNLVSFSGNADFPMNSNAYFRGIGYGSLEKISELWRQSPIAYFEGVTTPTLVIHSEGDLRCNIEQSEQVFYALQEQNVPSRFVRYPLETSHGMSRGGPADLKIHRLNEIVAWFAKYL